MTRHYLSIHLQSDATFGSGAGVAGEVDVDIAHDAYGCPEIGGRTLKGLLAEEWVNLAFVLGDDWQHWQPEATWLFGTTGALTTGVAQMHVGTATLPPDLRDALHHWAAAQSSDPRMPRSDLILDLLTTIRRQTAIDPVTGAYAYGSLRSMRVLLRETVLLAPLDFDHPPSQRALALLASCALAVRRGGTGRNRGRGHIRLLLHADIPTTHPPDDTFTRGQFAHFAAEVAYAGT